EIGVDPARGKPRDHLFQVGTQCRLAAGEMNLQHAQISGLVEQAQPGLRVEFPVGLEELERIGAIRTLQRTAMRQFGEHADGRKIRGIHGVTRRLSVHSCRKAMTSAASSSSSASYSRASASMMAPTVVFPSHRRKMSRLASLGQYIRSGESRAQ